MKLLNFLQLDFVENADDARTQCLWCGNEDSCEVKLVDNNQFQCWSCKKTGNAFTLIQKFYEDLSPLSPSEAKGLCALKPGIKPVTLRDIGVKHRIVKGESDWIFPVFNNEKHIVALYRYSKSIGFPLATPKPTSCTILGLENLSKAGDIWMLEGHWDYAAFLSHVEVEGFNVLGVCGSSFPNKYIGLLENRVVNFIADNDDAGRAGVQSLATRCKKVGMLPHSISYLDWAGVSLPSFSEVPNKFDTRDLILELTKG
jgi:hypothetical protein